MASEPTPVRVKICGVTSPDAARAAVAAGAAYIGLVLFPPSPRAVGLLTAAEIAAVIPDGVIKVALMVDPDDELIAAASDLPVDMLQLHGNETPERVREVREQTGLPVMKAVGLRDREDLAEIDRFSGVADQLLIDAKPPKGAVLPGGNALSFDWRLLAGRRWAVPWMLAGGLTPENVADAIRLTGARQVDVSSGVEAAPGKKDPAKIAAFIAAAQA